MTPSGLEPTPVGGEPAQVVCHNCGAIVRLPPIALPAERAAAQIPKGTAVLNRAAELEDATPTVPQPVSRALADTERLETAD